jgi:polyisoprenoid-binding protein YceI
MAATTWQIDTVHSSITFSVRHLIIAKVRGRFTKWSGALQIDDQHPEASRVDVRIDAASVDTNEPQRDAHLRSADFLDTDHFPELTFASTRVERRGDEELRITGDLTIRGITHPAVLEVEQGGQIKDPWGNDRRGFAAKTTIDRKAFNVSFNQVLDTGGFALGEKVEINLELEAFKPAAVAAATAAPAATPATASVN